MTILEASRAPERIFTDSCTMPKSEVPTTSSHKPSGDGTRSNRRHCSEAWAEPWEHFLPVPADTSLTLHDMALWKLMMRQLGCGQRRNQPTRAEDARGRHQHHRSVHKRSGLDGSRWRLGDQYLIFIIARIVAGSGGATETEQPVASWGAAPLCPAST
jgi:hypothetical protein